MSRQEVLMVGSILADSGKESGMRETWVQLPAREITVLFFVNTYGVLFGTYNNENPDPSLNTISYKFNILPFNLSFNLLSFRKFYLPPNLPLHPFPLSLILQQI